MTSIFFVVLVAHLFRFSAEAVDSTARIDPLNGLKQYRGGYDVTNKHYWSSACFRGIHGYVVAALWVLCGLAYGGFLIVRKRSEKIEKRSRSCYLIPRVFSVVLLTLLAITASGLVLGENERFHSRARKVVEIIINTADEASYTIHNTSGAIKFLRSSLADANAFSPEASEFLTSTSISLDSQASEIVKQANRNRRRINTGFRIVYVVTTVTVSLTLVSAIALTALGLLNFNKTLRVVIAICWTLTVLCWLLCGAYFFLQNFAGDTCAAIESFQKDPYNNSLSSILPCESLLSASSVLGDVSAGVYDLVNEVNDKISTSYGDIVQICNPFSGPPYHEYQPHNCPNSSIQIGDIPNVLRMLACPDSETKCNGGIVIPAEYYNTVDAYSASLQRLLDVYPGVERLVECETVKDAFSEILRRECGPLRRYARMVWAGLVFLSVVMVGLVVGWVIRPNENDRGCCSRVYTAGATPDHMLESGIHSLTEDTIVLTK